MKWRPRKGGGDVEDRRGQGGGGGFRLPGGGGGGLPIPMGRGGGIGTIILIIIIYLVFGRGACGSDGGAGFDTGDELNPFPDVPAEEQGGAPGPGEGQGPDAQDQTEQFMEFVVGDVQDFWAQEFQAAGRDYPRATLVLFKGQTSTGCGPGSSATGPFYCPLDSMAYIDLSFFRQLAQQFEAPGDFPQAYVIAHEIGHHVQNVLGIDDKVQDEAASGGDQNDLSVRLELQADCLAGVWARSTYERGILEEGDLDEGINAASQIGDDRIQEKTQGRIDPESFTHGSAEQRSHWLQEGYDKGELEACDSFSGDI